MPARRIAPAQLTLLAILQDGTPRGVADLPLVGGTRSARAYHVLELYIHGWVDRRNTLGVFTSGRRYVYHINAAGLAAWRAATTEKQ